MDPSINKTTCGKERLNSAQKKIPAKKKFPPKIPAKKIPAKKFPRPVNRATGRPALLPCCPVNKVRDFIWWDFFGGNFFLRENVLMVKLRSPDPGKHSLKARNRANPLSQIL
jgi:hypothetical protein